ncbi:MAG: ComEC/Rec2 family competence protein, partial [Rickettsiales bacterium]|nr:ComEC/Rec2 family competence protein [Rickettsiales bacterium]
KAVLLPPPSPAYPGGYDFARDAYFKQIGAVGYSLSKVYLKQEGSPDWGQSVEALRQAITSRILAQLEGHSSAPVATALLTGERKAIPDTVQDTMRAAGIGHLLAISGLHLALVAGLWYGALRFGFVLFPGLVLRYPVKQWAAIGALLGGLGYLLIAGAPVSAQRAYLMVGLFFLAILLHREITPMRPVALAAFIILALRPESLTGPSFQMSFAAVIALIAFYEIVRRYRAAHPIPYAWYMRPLLYVLSLAAASLVAGTATAPFAIYHFGAYALYGLAGNMVAVPLAGTLIMPTGILALLLMPLGLDHLPLTVMSYGIRLMLDYAAWLHSLPHALLSVGTLTLPVIVLIAIGGLWLCLWQTRIRILGVILILIGISVRFILGTAPDMIVDEGGKLFALRLQDGHYAFSDLRPARFARTMWMQAVGQENPLRLRDVSDDPAFSCSAGTCEYTAGHIPARIVTQATQNTCPQSGLLIWLEEKIPSCPPATSIITKETLACRGTVAIWLTSPPRLYYSGTTRGTRRWTHSC